MVMKKIIEGIFDVKMIVDESLDTKSFYFELPSFIYDPGNFVMLSLPEDKEDKKKRRAYSISSSPSETIRTNLISVTIKLVEGGYFTTKIFSEEFSKNHPRLFLAGPYGHSVFSNRKPSDIKSIALFAGGSGIAPVRSLMKYFYDLYPNVNVTLFYSFRTPDEYAFKNDIEEMLKNINYKGFITVTRYQGDYWRGLRGRIDRNLLLDTLTGSEDMYYLCGNISFVDEIKRILLTDLGISKDKVISEAWG